MKLLGQRLVLRAVGQSLARLQFVRLRSHLSKINRGPNFRVIYLRDCLSDLDAVKTDLFRMVQPVSVPKMGFLPHAKVCGILGQSWLILQIVLL